MKNFITQSDSDSRVIPTNVGTPSQTMNLCATPSLTTNLIRRILLIFICLFGIISHAGSQSLYVTSGGNVVAQNVAVSIAANATVSTGVTALVATTVSISTNFVTGQDVLGINGNTSGTETYGDGNIAFSYNSTSGILTLTGASTAANYQATIRKTTYTNSSATPTTATRSISFCLNGAVPFTGNNHFFEYVTNSAISWADANTAASASRLFGLKGYLATITSDAENTFCASKIGAAGAWLGGNAVDGDGSVWKWVTGPAAEQIQFWSGINYGSAVSGQYANWNSQEPNSGLHGEDYVQFFPGSGSKWNNLNGASNPTYISGYIVEYGGISGDPVIHITDNVNVTITQGITATGDPFSAFATCTGTASNSQDFTVSGSLSDSESNSNCTSRICTFHIGRWYLFQPAQYIPNRWSGRCDNNLRQVNRCIGRFAGRKYQHGLHRTDNQKYCRHRHSNGCISRRNHKMVRRLR